MDASTVQNVTAMAAKATSAEISLAKTVAEASTVGASAVAAEAALEHESVQYGNVSAAIF
jgi:hypothetical protein